MSPKNYLSGGWILQRVDFKSLSDQNGREISVKNCMQVLQESWREQRTFPYKKP